jgi:hypothetical protein
MPETGIPTPAKPALGRGAVRLVLFGMPDAGKSSLLGALAQSAQIQEHLLNGHITDPSHGLAELQRRLYENRPRETLEEVVPFPVSFEPFATPGHPAAGRVEGVLIDCDGRVANELISRRRALDDQSAEGSLARAILDADALLLVVDAAASPSQVEADFTEFGRFLRLLEQNRGRRTDVGGLPVFLVLSKCDLLAKPADTPAEWMDRIEERKRELDIRFHDFLSHKRTEGPLPFGRLDLHLWATAVKRPELTGSPAKPQEPYGVAELFRQAFDYARAFQRRRAQSGRRLFWTVAGCTGVVAGMLALATTFYANHRTEEPGVRDLQSKIESYRMREGTTPSARLREPLQRKISELTDLKNDPDFSRLPEEQRGYIDSHLRELHEYQTNKRELERIPPLDTATTEPKLEDIGQRLKDLQLPPEHAADWGQTEAALERERRLDDVRKLRNAVDEMEEWYRDLERRGDKLWTFSDQQEGAPAAWTDWRNQVQALLDEAENPPHRPGEPLRESTLTYDVVFRFARVAAARDAWETRKHSLQRVRDLATALGLAGVVPGLSPLDIPSTFALEQARDRVRDLERACLHYADDFSLMGLPEKIAGEIRRATRTRYEHLLKVGRDTVLRHLEEVSPEPRETPASWRALRRWLENPEDLKDWRILARVLGRLQDPNADDPVTVLDRFLRQDRFDLVSQRLVLEIPDTVKIRPAGKMTVHQRSGETTSELSFEATGDESHDPRRGSTRYRFRPTGDAARVYRPGDSLWADLPCRKGDDRDWMLTWARNRSQVYQFERLIRPPRLHRRDQENTQGESEEGIALEVSPEDGVPRVPDLMPAVPLKFDKQ